MPLGLLTLLFIGLASGASIINSIQITNATSNATLADGNPLDIVECTPKPPTPKDTRPLLAWCRTTVEIYPFPKSETIGIFHVSGEPDEFKLPFTASIEDKTSGGCEITVDIPYHVSDSYSWFKIWQDTKNLMETCREEHTNYPHTGGYTMTGNLGKIKITITTKHLGEVLEVGTLGMNRSAIEWMS